MKQKFVLLSLLLLPFEMFSWNGTGTSNDPYLISSETDLRQLAWEVNEGNSFTGAYFQLTNNITLTQNWIPIGNEGDEFEGFFNGNNHTISGLSITNSENEYYGLFIHLSYGRIENVVISGDITNNNSDGDGAGICCFCNNSVITNCTNNCTMTGDGDYAGICLHCENSEITNCNNNGTILGGDGCTGICHYCLNSIITNCTNHSQINGYYASGICLFISNSSISNCNNYGTVNSNNNNSQCSGICFQASNTSSINNCHNHANITGFEAAGICGFTDEESSINGCANEGNIIGTGSQNHAVGVSTHCEGNVSNCSNNGNITGCFCSGVIGFSDNMITNCFNTGNINCISNSSGNASGICYSSEGTIAYCYNSGNIQGSGPFINCGGIVSVLDGTVSNCYNTGSINGSFASGGICGIGGSYGEFHIINCYNSGIVSDQTIAGGIMGSQGYYNNGTIISCYNSGYIYSEDGLSGAIMGNPSNELLTNCFFDKQLCPSNEENIIGHIEGRLTSNMTGTSLQSVLGNSNWSFSTNLFPRLKELDNTESAIVSAIPVFLNTSGSVFDNCDQVTRNFSVGTSNGVTWTRHGSGNSLNISGISNGNVSINSSGSDTLAAKKNGIVYKLVPFHVYAPITISATATPQNGGSITGAGQYYYGETVELRAVPANNYSFTNWTENGNVISTNATLSFTAVENRQLKANFTYYDSNEESFETPICIYPNPSCNSVTIEGKNIKNVIIYNLFGHIVYAYGEASTDVLQLAVSNLPNGLYFIEIQLTSGIITKKLIKE